MITSTRAIEDLYHVPGKAEIVDGQVVLVEVRSEGDYGPAMEKAMVAKRTDYFAAGTLIVWDVDLLSDDVIKSYSASSPGRPIIFRRGQSANAEPAVPGWSLAVDDLFP
jgi:hypothetical protein